MTDGSKDTAASGSLYLVKMMHSSETHCCAFKDRSEVAVDDVLVIETRYGRDLARVLSEVPRAATEADRSDSTGHDVHAVVRKASEADLRKFNDNKTREADAYAVCREKIRQHGLDMKLVSAHYLLEEAKILFFFTSDARVDFRELVKDLVSVFKMRIELRQIGVRDEARVVGGLGVCGRALCCHSLTDKLKPVSIKMAKVQNLSLNSMKISGPCGRLLCCLAYEYDTYHEEKRRLPPEGYRLNYDGAQFRISEINILSRMAKMASDDGRILEIPFSRLSERDGRWEIGSLETKER